MDPDPPTTATERIDTVRDEPTDVLRRSESARPPRREWLTTITQVVIAVVAGAALWMGFRWLWGAWPIIAVIGTVIVVGGLVGLVSWYRHRHDEPAGPLTLVATALVGLFIAVSPAMLLLQDWSP